MGKTYRSDNEENDSSYVDFYKKKHKTSKIKGFLDKKSNSDKYEYLEKNQTIDNSKD